MVNMCTHYAELSEIREQNGRSSYGWCLSEMHAWEEDIPCDRDLLTQKIYKVVLSEAE